MRGAAQELRHSTRYHLRFQQGQRSETYFHYYVQYDVLTTHFIHKLCLIAAAIYKYQAQGKSLRGSIGIN